jgi:hypothetical protein
VAARLFLLAGVLPAVATAQAPVSITVSTRGAVAHPGPRAYPAGARLSTVGMTSGVAPDAYLLGAAWLQPALREEQLRLRAGLVYELGAIRLQALGRQDTALASASAGFEAWLSTLPVTGRKTGVALDPLRLEVAPAEDRPVHEGDTLVFPDRPADIRVVGAVEAACRLPHVPMQDARRYLSGCRPSAAADPDAIYVVQPDGAVFAQGVALWNRDPPRPLAPGAWIYVPFDRRAIAGAADADFNRDVATFLATQVPGEAEWR